MKNYMRKIKFHLPNFVNTLNAQLNYSVIMLLKRHPDWFYENVEIGSVFDSFPVIWNGGRIVAGHMTKEMIEYHVPQIFQIFNRQGVPCRLTFTNPVLTEEDLKDATSNRILELADNGINEVIVVSELLENYIRQTHPKIKITSSTCKQLRQQEEVREELEKDYSLVVLDYNLNKDMDALKQIVLKEKCEILINPICDPECSRRGEHYRYIGVYQKTHCGNKHAGENFKNMDWKCECLKKSVFDRRNSPCYLSPEQIYDELVPMGYCNFKIEGRGNSFLDLIEQYVYYMALPKYKDQMRYQLLTEVLGAWEAMKR